MGEPAASRTGLVRFGRPGVQDLAVTRNRGHELSIALPTCRACEDGISGAMGQQGTVGLGSQPPSALQRVHVDWPALAQHERPIAETRYLYRSSIAVFPNRTFVEIK